VVKIAKALEGRSLAASFRNLHGGMVICLHEIAEVLEAVRYDVEDRSGIRKRCILRQPSDAQAWLPPDAPGFGHMLTADNLKECRLARAVAPDDGYALASLYLQACIVEKRKMPEGDRHVIKCNERQGNSNQKARPEADTATWSYANASFDANSS
jgi:hypothetical protein